MFDWFWEFLYQISKLLFWASDLMMETAFKLCGISPISFDGKSTDFITYLIESDDMQWAYAALCIIAVSLLFIMTIVAILIALSKRGETNSATPMQIFMKAAKSLLMFIFVPAVLIIFTAVSNTFMLAVYKATLRGGNSIGSFLFVVFASDAGLTDSAASKFLSGDYDYNSTGTVQSQITLKNFMFILSWIVGAVVVYYLSSTLLQFVDRAIEICILFLAAPFCIASSVLDEGARFKTWRDQVISKYLGAYGAIVAVNVYCLVCSAIVDSRFHFDDNRFINYCCKVMICLGGALTMKKAMVLVATLVSQTAAADQNDPAFKGNAFGSAMGALAGGAAKITGLSAIGAGIKGKIGDTVGKLERGLRAKLGLTTDADREKEKSLRDLNPTGGGSASASGAENNEKPNYDNDNKDSLNKALEGGEENKPDGNNENSNNAENKQGNQMLNNALNNGGDDKKDDTAKQGDE